MFDFQVIGFLGACGAMPDFAEACALLVAIVGIGSLLILMICWGSFLREKVRGQREKNRLFKRKFEAQERERERAANNLARVARITRPVNNNVVFETIDLQAPDEGRVMRTLRAEDFETSSLINQGTSAAACV